MIYRHPTHLLPQRLAYCKRHLSISISAKAVLYISILGGAGASKIHVCGVRSVFFLDFNTDRSEPMSLKDWLRSKLLRFNVLFAIALILLAVALCALWAFVVMPICNESGWKPPCPPRW